MRIKTYNIKKISKVFIYVLALLFASCSNQPQVEPKKDNPQVFFTDSIKFTYSLTDKEGNYINVFKQNSWFILKMEIENTKEDTIMITNNNDVGLCYSADTDECIEELSFWNIEADTVKDLYTSIAPHSSIRKSGIHSISSVQKGRYYFKAPDVSFIIQHNGLYDTVNYTIPLSILFEIE